MMLGVILVEEIGGDASDCHPTNRKVKAVILLRYIYCMLLHNILYIHANTCEVIHFVLFLQLNIDFPAVLLLILNIFKFAVLKFLKQLPNLSD